MNEYQEYKKLAPVVLFTYDRLSETIQTIEALKRNFLAPQSELFIFSDGPKHNAVEESVYKVRKYLRNIEGFKNVTIYESTLNKGLANSIIDGVSLIIEQFGKVIVLEDDLLTSPNFLDFMNQGLDFYQSNDLVKSINGYSLHIPYFESYDSYFQNRPYSWGWATWKRNWNKQVITNNCHFEESMAILASRKYKELMGEDALQMLNQSVKKVVDSWYSKWIFLHYEENKVSVYPKLSKVQNIGFSQKATHCKGINVHEIKMDYSKKREFKFPENIAIRKKHSRHFLKYFSNRHKIKYRLKLLKTSEGRNQIYSEIKSRIC